MDPFIIVLIIVVFCACVLLGVPISFSIGMPAILVLMLTDMEMFIAPQMFVKGPSSFSLLAIPFFIFAGNMMNTAGVSQRIFDFCLSIIGHVKGGLAYVNVLASMVFAGISGSSTADAAGLGKIEMQAMEREGYDKNFSAAITAASAIIGPIIPPSIIMVIYANEARISVGSMFKGGIVLGALIGLALMAGVFYAVKRGVKVGPPTTFSLRNVFKSLWRSILSIIAPLIILAGMFSGRFTPTEAGVVAVVYSMVVGFIYGELKWRDIPAIIEESAISTANCMFMTAGASLLGWVVTYSRLPILLAEALFALTDSKYVFLLLVVVFMLFLGCLMESIAGLLIITPILLPIAVQFGIDPLHFGCVLCYGMLIGGITPPMGSLLFTVCAVSGAKFEGVVAKCVPFIVTHAVVLLVLCFFPEIVTWLPSVWKS